MDSLEGLSVGDKVILHAGGVYGGRSVQTVTRITKTLIITKTGRYRISSGVAPGSGWYSSSISVATDERIKDVLNENRRLRLSHELKAYKWSEASLETLEKVIKVID